MIAKRFKKCRAHQLTLRKHLFSLLTLGMLLFGINGYSQIKPKLPQKFQSYSEMSRAVSYATAPSGYTQVGTTDLCYKQQGPSIDIKGYFNGSWYRSTYSDGGYKVAISVTVNSQESSQNNVIAGMYSVDSWRGIEKHWTEGECLRENYVGEDNYSATLIENEDNVVTLTNFVSFGGSITGKIDKENHTIVFPAQKFDISSYDGEAVFGKQTPEVVTNPYETSPLLDVVATYDENFNIIMNDWCILASASTERILICDNTLSMTKNIYTSEGAYTAYCNNGDLYNGVLFSSYVEQQGELARICYSLTNTNNLGVTISLGTHADVMIGNNDSAPISRRKDQLENTYGLTMKDGNGAELCVLFGAGLAGVSRVDDFWFGHYGLNREANQMVGNYTPGNNYMQENGSYDSGMGWCWKNRTIPAGATVVYSYLIGVGDVNLEPNSSFEVTPDDPDGWNDLSRPHKLTLNGVYDSPAGIDGMIEYAVEDSEQWIPLTQMLASGTEFTEDLIALFDPDKEAHTLRFRTVDAVGNTTLLTPIVYKDVYHHEVIGIENKVYNYGDSIYQTSLVCDLPEEQYVINEYHGNVNVGTATFMVQGVFPNSIGRRSYSFQISPRPLEGELVLDENYFVYNGKSHLPNYQFTCERPDNLILDSDYTLEYMNNIYPGEGTVEVTGKGNYTGKLSATFTIDKAPLTSSLYQLIIPNEDISYDGEAHGATVNKEVGVGEVVFTYVNTEDNSIGSEAPSDEGSYEIYVEFKEGSYYYGKENEKIGAFSIYKFDQNEWVALNALKPQLVESGWTPSWNLEAGPVAVGKFEGLVIEKGHVVEINFPEHNLTTVPTSLSAFTEVRSLNLSNNNLSGNAGLIAAALPKLTSLNLSYNKFSDLYPMISPEVVLLDLSHQSMDVVVPINFSEINKDVLVKSFPTILLYDHQNQTYRTEIGLLVTTCQSMNIGKKDWGMNLEISNDGFSIMNVSDNNAYYGESGDELNVFDYDSESSFKITLNFVPGDANFFGGVEATDLQTTILYAFGQYKSYPFNFTAADTYKDNNINVQDVVCTVNILLSGLVATESPSVMSAPKLGCSEVEEAEASIYMEDGNIILSTYCPVAVISAKADGNVAWSLDKYGLTQSVQGGNVVGYSLSGATIPSGQTVIGSYNGEVNLGHVSLSDEDAQNITVTIGKNQTSGIDINFNDLIEEETEIYDITGRRINTLSNGVNIIRKGNKTIKVIGGVIKN